MANSRIPVSLNPPEGLVATPAKTPGTTGLNDHADPNVTTRAGDTAGSLGIGDHADPSLPKVSLGTGLTQLADGTAVAPGLDQKTPDPDKDVFIYADYSTITTSVGNGFCVPLVQQKTKVGGTKDWKAGEKLTDKPELKAGTAIATFNAKGVYENKAEGNHAAFFVKYETRDGAEGIVIYEQYREWPKAQMKAIADLKTAKEKIEKSLLDPKSDGPKLRLELVNVGGKLDAAEKKLIEDYPEVDEKGRRFRRKQPGERFVRFGQSGSPSNNASAYSVITH